MNYELSTSKPDSVRKPDPLWDNTNRVLRVIRKFESYRKIYQHVRKSKVPLVDIIRSQFPFFLPDATKPPIVTLEFTNVCDLRCVYCSSTSKMREKGYMTIDTYSNILRSIKKTGISRLRIVGNGEPTLHPDFSYFLTKLAQSVNYLSVLTNGQWRKDEIAQVMIEAPVNLIEISIDAGGKETYENSRMGGDFNRLMNNLKLLGELKQKFKSSSMIKIRLMLRPSQKSNERHLVRQWLNYADIVQPNYIYKIKGVGYEEDVFTSSHQKYDKHPKCTLPFKVLDINWDGNVPLCSFSLSQVGPPDYLLGNINVKTIEDLWNSKIMSQYRIGHRRKNLSQIPICKGCIGI